MTGETQANRGPQVDPLVQFSPEAPERGVVVSRSHLTSPASLSLWAVSAGWGLKTTSECRGLPSSLVSHWENDG